MSSSPTTTLLLKNALVIATMDDEQREIANGSVFIRGNRVEAVGPAIELPDTADKVIDMTGHVLIPGLINTHHHISSHSPAPCPLRRTPSCSTG